MYQGNVMIPTI